MNTQITAPSNGGGTDAVAKDGPTQVVMGCSPIRRSERPRLPRASTRLNPDFMHLPAELQDRVGFWKDVFTKYGRNQYVLNNAFHPHVVYGVVNLSDRPELQDTPGLDKGTRQRREAARQEIFDQERERIRGSLLKLAAGGKADGAFERNLESQFASLPGIPIMNYKLAAKHTARNDAIHVQRGQRELHAAGVARAQKILPVVEQVFLELNAAESDPSRRVPLEFTRLPYIESAMNPQARSRSNALGLFQIKPGTAQPHGVSASELYSVRPSAHAAYKILQGLHTEFRSWPLTAMAYHRGPGNVRPSINGAGGSNIRHVINYEQRLFEGDPDGAIGYASTNYLPELAAVIELDQNPSSWPNEFVQDVKRAKAKH